MKPHLFNSVFFIFFAWSQSASSQPAVNVDEAMSGMVITFNEDYVFTKRQQAFYLETTSEFSNTEDRNMMRSKVYVTSPNGDILVNRGSKAHIAVVWRSISHGYCAKSRAQTYEYEIYLTKAKAGYPGFSKDELEQSRWRTQWRDVDQSPCSNAQDFYISENKIPGLTDYKSIQRPLTIDIRYVKSDRDSFPPLKDFLLRCCGMNVSVERDRANMKTF